MAFLQTLHDWWRRATDAGEMAPDDAASAEMRRTMAEIERLHREITALGQPITAHEQERLETLARSYQELQATPRDYQEKSPPA